MDMTQKAHAIKAKMDNKNTLRSFCMSKETVNRVKSQPRKSEKIFANHINFQNI